MENQQTSRIKKQLKAIDKANELLHNGKIRLYKEALQDMLPTFLPDYPLRFTMELKRPSKAALEAIVAIGREEGKQPELFINTDGDLGHNGFVIGRVNKDSRNILMGIGKDMLDLYSVTIVEVKYDGDSPMPSYLAFELKRPELWINSDGILCAGEEGAGSKTDPHATPSVEAPIAPIARMIEEEIRRKSGGDEPKYARGSGN